MQIYSFDHDQVVLPEQVFPLIRECMGDDTSEECGEILKAVASSIMLSHTRPSRLAFSHVSETLALAREQGISDPQMNRFLKALEQLFA